MSGKLSDKEEKAVLDALDKTIKEGPWSSSNFLKQVGEKIRVARDKFASKVSAAHKPKAPVIDKLSQRMNQHSDLQNIYVALYSSAGSSIPGWEAILANLPGHIISRPIYEKEEDVKEFMRASTKPANEGYAVISINKSAILNLSDKQLRHDRFGKPLLALQTRTIPLESILRFEHNSGSYRFQRGRLFKT